MSIITSDSGGAIWKKELASGGSVEFQAKTITREKTGLHAHLAILSCNVIVAHSYFNLLRDEDRVRLSNSAYGLFSGSDKEVYSKEMLRHDLGIFTLELEDWLETQWQPVLVNGKHSEAPGFWLKPYIIQGGGTILYGPPGTGKSWITLGMAVSIDAGLSNLWATQQGCCLFVNLERSRESLERRLAQVNDALGLPSGRPLLMMNMRGKSLREVAASMRRGVKDKGVKVGFLDSISRSGMGKMNEDSTANAIIDTMNSLELSWVGVGHTPRGDDTHQYGSQMFDAGEDVGVRIISARQAGKLGVGLEVTKANDLPPVDLAVFSLEFSGYALAALRSASIRDFPEMAAKEKATTFETVVGYMRMAGQSDATTIARETGLESERSNISRLLNTSPLFHRVSKNGKSVVYELAPASPDPF